MPAYDVCRPLTFNPNGKSNNCVMRITEILTVTE